MTGTEFLASIKALSGPAREAAILDAVRRGDVPTFFKDKAWPQVKAYLTLPTGTHELIYAVSPWPLVIGTDDDFAVMPAEEATYQAIADAYYAILPTKQMVKAIHAAATTKIDSNTMTFPPDAAMTTTQRYIDSNTRIMKAVRALGAGDPDTLFVSGIKKDVVIAPNQDGSHVVIFGWIQPNGSPIQGYSPLAHKGDYVDYSHSGRLISRHAKLDGADIDLVSIFSDPLLHPLVSDQGRFVPRWPNAGGSPVPIVGQSKNPSGVTPVVYVPPTEKPSTPQSEPSKKSGGNAVGVAAVGIAAVVAIALKGGKS